MLTEHFTAGWENKAPLLESGQREAGEAGKDPGKSSLRLQEAHQRAPKGCKPSGGRILCRKSFFVKSAGGTLVQGKTKCPQNTAQVPRAAPARCQCYKCV